MHLKISSAKWLPFCPRGELNIGDTATCTKLSVFAFTFKQNKNIQISHIIYWWPGVAMISGINRNYIGLTCMEYFVVSTRRVHSLAPGRFQFNFRCIIFKLTLVNGGWGISYEIALKWMPLDLTDDKSTLVQVRQQAITWANVDPDLCCQMASLGLIELMLN